MTNFSQEESYSKFLPVAAGCIAGAIEATAVWPMEFIKTQLQLQVKQQKQTTQLLQNQITTTPIIKPLPYTGMISGISHTVQTTGFFSLYRGLSPTLLGSMPKAGIRFGLNAQFQDFFRHNPYTRNSNPTWTNFMAGLGAGIWEALIIVVPVETVKTKCIELNLSFVQGMKYIVKKEGLQGIYKGATATALKQGSNQGLRFMWFHEYKRWILAQKNQNSSEAADPSQYPITTLSSMEKFLGGMTAGCFSTLGNNPFDVVKTRMQGTNANQYANTLDCMQQIVRKEGVSALYSGLIPRLGRVVPGQGIIFFSFETIQDFLKQMHVFRL